MERVPIRTNDTKLNKREQMNNRKSHKESLIEAYINLSPGEALILLTDEKEPITELIHTADRVDVSDVKTYKNSINIILKSTILDAKIMSLNSVYFIMNNHIIDIQNVKHHTVG